MSFADLKKQSKLEASDCQTGQGSRKDEHHQYW